MNLNAKLAIGAAIMVATVGYVAYLGASSSYQYYVLVDECVDDADDLRGKRVRVSGHVQAGSLVISEDRSETRFILGGKQHQLFATCRGPLPDNLAEDMDVVVEGTLQEAGTLHGDKVITRCASKYAGNEGARNQVEYPR